VLVEDGGQNAIVIAPESNARLSLEDVRAFLAGAEAGETILLQNECAHLEATIELAARAGLRTWLNASPQPTVSTTFTRCACRTARSS